MKTKRIFTVGPNKSQFEITDMEQVILNKLNNGEFSITQEKADEKRQKYINKGGLWQVCSCSGGGSHFFKTEHECVEWAIELKKRTSISDDHTVKFLD